MSLSIRAVCAFLLILFWAAPGRVAATHRPGSRARVERACAPHGPDAPFERRSGGAALCHGQRGDVRRRERDPVAPRMARGRRHALVPGDTAPAHGDLDVAAAAAAHAVLIGEHASLADVYDEQLTTIWRPATTAGRAGLGRQGRRRGAGTAHRGRLDAERITARKRRARAFPRLVVGRAVSLLEAVRDCQRVSVRGVGPAGTRQPSVRQRLRGGESAGRCCDPG